ncbi:MAG: hypothetical protein EZS28_008822 [Streblomastix strix]|uniref:Uncharacterized protein n=1 Tax=Streblomastix strix TaxID=222440 RepID=A0A5J4WLF8_9EUKA|nr:MAG: hypothetical protein EZS28_008822 [Streblomastix strix]
MSGKQKEISLSIEETNKLRAQAGLSLLPVNIPSQSLKIEIVNIPKQISFQDTKVGNTKVEKGLQAISNLRRINESIDHFTETLPQRIKENKMQENEKNRKKEEELKETMKKREQGQLEYGVEQ